jgi:hypothetical protein
MKQIHPKGVIAILKAGSAVSFLNCQDTNYAKARKLIINSIQWFFFALKKNNAFESLILIQQYSKKI